MSAKENGQIVRGDVAKVWTDARRLFGLVAPEVQTGCPVGVDRPFETSRQGIFAIGDMRAGSARRVAPAAGGSVVVPGIYEFLGEQFGRWNPHELRVPTSTHVSEVALGGPTQSEFRAMEEA